MWSVLLSEASRSFIARGVVEGPVVAVVVVSNRPVARPEGVILSGAKNPVWCENWSGGIDIGMRSLAFPVTPPCVRVRTRRFVRIKRRKCNAA